MAESANLRDIKLNPATTASIRRKLLGWYAKNRRDIPWRKGRTPYRIWVSEIMAQQTRIETMTPYFDRFMDRFPAVAALADAQADDVLAAWSGLGYYGRARNLHNTAKQIVKQHNGKLPATVDELMKLPGIGRYTAGAIASIAFGIAAPALDGNGYRVLSRLFDLEIAVDSTAGQKAMWNLAQKLVPEKSPGDFNEALMEQGATVCLPTQPQCFRCSLKVPCMARKAGTILERPVHSPRKPPPEILVYCFAVFDNKGRVLLVQNPLEGLFAGLFVLPFTPRDLALRKGTPDIQLECEAVFGENATPGPILAHVEHVLTHRKMKVEVVSCKLKQSTALPEGYRSICWIDLKKPTQGIALAGFTRKVLEALIASEGYMKK